MTLLTEKQKQLLSQNQRASYEILEESYHLGELTEEGKVIMENLYKQVMNKQERADSDDDNNGNDSLAYDLFNEYVVRYTAGECQYVQEVLAESGLPSDMKRKVTKLLDEIVDLSEQTKELVGESPTFCETKDKYIDELNQHISNLQSKGKTVLAKAFYVKASADLPKSKDNLKERFLEAWDQFEEGKGVTDALCKEIMLRIFAYQSINIRNLGRNYMDINHIETLLAFEEVILMIHAANMIQCVRSVTGMDKPITADEAFIGFLMADHSHDLARCMFSYAADKIVKKDKIKSMLFNSED